MPDQPLEEALPKTNGVARPRPKHPDFRKATPEALARALLRPLTAPDPSLRKGRVSGESA